MGFPFVFLPPPFALNLGPLAGASATETTGRSLSEAASGLPVELFEARGMNEAAFTLKLGRNALITPSASASASASESKRSAGLVAGAASGANAERERLAEAIAHVRLRCSTLYTCVENRTQLLQKTESLYSTLSCVRV